MSSQRRSKLQEKKLDAVVSEKGSDTTFKETPQTTSDGTGPGHDSGVSAAATMQPPIISAALKYLYLFITAPV